MFYVETVVQGAISFYWNIVIPDVNVALRVKLTKNCLLLIINISSDKMAILLLMSPCGAMSIAGLEENTNSFKKLL